MFAQAGQVNHVITHFVSHHYLVSLEKTYCIFADSGTPDQQGTEATKNLRIEILFVHGIEEDKFHVRAKRFHFHFEGGRCVVCDSYLDYAHTLSSTTVELGEHEFTVTKNLCSCYPAISSTKSHVD